MARRTSPSIDMRDPAGRAGLRQRLDEKRDAAIGKSTLLPVFSLPQVADRPRKRRPIECPVCEELARELEGKGEIGG
jgi:hypothetical protein